MSLPEKAFMFEPGKTVCKGLFISIDDFTNPVGVAPGLYFSHQIDAKDKGWSDSGHSDFQDVSLYKIVDWYNDAFFAIK